MGWRERTPMWTLAWLLLLFGCTPAWGGTITLDDATSRARLAPELDVLHDRSGEMDLAGAQAALQAGRFTPLARTSMGFGRGAYWFHVSLGNTDPLQRRWLLVQNFALTERIDMYVVPRSGPLQSAHGGTSLPFINRAIGYRYPNFWVDIDPGTQAELYVRMRSHNSMQVELSLYRASDFVEAVRDAQTGIGLYYGILLALLVYNLVLWLSLREPDYFWYVVHILAFGFALFVYNGLAFQYLWPGAPQVCRVAMPLSLSIALIGMLQFARKFLELRQRWPAGDRANCALIGVCAVLALVSCFAPFHATPLSSAAVLLCVGWLALAAVRSARTGYRPARMFLLAWTLFLAGAAMFAAVAFGALPRNFVTEYGVQFGSAMEMLLLSLALGNRYAELRAENERIVREAKARLETEVQQRTAELRHALAQLGDAHTRLRESSRRDGLTGLLTRSHFREAFGTLLLRARESGQPLCILMIDVDHFKNINDRLGHLVGDECLRWTAHAVGQALRPYDALLARFGGEEFVVALPNVDRDKAVRIAEEVRDGLQREPCSGSDYRVEITASIGVHQVDASIERLDAALQRADEALYQAKNDGRNCVRWA